MPERSSSSINGLRDKESYRRTRVQIIDPLTGKKQWEYTDPFFYSSIEGVAQPLWNGNTMITSSRGGRIFEITPDGEVVWQWEPSFAPMRAIRYPRDHTPQLARLAPEPLETRSRVTAYVDSALFEFLVPEQKRRQRRQLPGWRGKLMREPQGCRLLLIPMAATLELGYGLHEEALEAKQFSARFTAEIRNLETGEIKPSLRRRRPLDP